MRLALALSARTAASSGRPHAGARAAGLRARAGPQAGRAGARRRGVRQGPGAGRAGQCRAYGVEVVAFVRHRRNERGIARMIRRRRADAMVYGGITRYEAMAVALDALARGGNTRQGVISAFFATRDRASVLGTYSIDANGDTTLADYGGYVVTRGGRLAFRHALLARP